MWLKGRLDLLVKNGAQGLVLVFIILALFLRFQLSFWVTIGIPISFFGTIMVMPGFDQSINMLSLFAFILVLGIVVDDAIVVGENASTKSTQRPDRGSRTRCEAGDARRRSRGAGGHVRGPDDDRRVRADASCPARLGKDLLSS